MTCDEIVIVGNTRHCPHNLVEEMGAAFGEGVDDPWGSA